MVKGGQGRTQGHTWTPVDTHTHTHTHTHTQVHGFPKVMGVLTHLDGFQDPKRLKKAKKTLKVRALCVSVRVCVLLVQCVPV